MIATNKKVILLTHHNGLAEVASTTGLWDQVMSAFPEGQGPACWYWGHVHAGVVYRTQDRQAKRGVPLQRPRGFALGIGHRTRQGAKCSLV